MAKYIPNFNTLSTLIDRLSIENVKLSHFENSIEHDQLNETQRSELKSKVKTQVEIIGLLKEELTKFLKDTFLAQEYDYVKEERTFR